MRGVGSAGPDASVNRAHFSGGEKSGNLGLQVGHDGRDAVEWIAAQPWSSGEVFMYGGSYLGMTQWRTAAQLPPHLSGIAPSVPIYPGWDIPNTNGIPEAFTAVILVYVAGRAPGTLISSRAITGRKDAGTLRRAGFDSYADKGLESLRGAQLAESFL